MSVNKMLDTLKPCPFCGSVPKVFSDTLDSNRDFYYVDCTSGNLNRNHRARTFMFLTYEEAVKAWNTRFEGD